MSLCKAETSQLLVIDVQERLGAAMPAKVINRVINNGQLLLRVAGLLGVPVTCTEQYPEGLGPTLPELKSLLPAGSPRLEKTSFSAAADPGVEAAIAANDGRRQVILGGMEAHVCVLQTAIDLAARGHQVIVVEDAICSRKLENYQNALERLRQEGIGIVSAESVVFEWMGDSRHPHFKAISALLR